MSDRSKISDLLHLFLDLYEKDPSGLDFLLSECNPFGFLDELISHIPARDQYNLLLRSHRQAQQEVLAKTLIQTSSLALRHKVIREQLSEFDLDSTSYEGIEERYKPLPDVDPGIDAYQKWWDEGGGSSRFYLMMAAAHGISIDEYQARRARQELSSHLLSKKLDSELLRFFADRIDEIVTAIEGLPSKEFHLFIPDRLATPFRELHINAVLGNYGTACILCGSLLEQTLRDRLEIDSADKIQLYTLIKDAKTRGWLKGRNPELAHQILHIRNDVVHGAVRFDAVRSEDAWHAITITRTLVSDLYKDKLN